LAGLAADLLPIEREAERMGLPGSRLDDIRVYGTPLDTLIGAHFRLPSGLDVQFGLPNFLKKALKRNLLAFPAVDTNTCVLCGACRDACPPVAISIRNSALLVDKARCIRCWCCRELCPHNAMTVKRGLLLAALTALAGRKKRSQPSSSSAPIGISR
jgi:ferredoxin